MSGLPTGEQVQFHLQQLVDPDGDLEVMKQSENFLKVDEMRLINHVDLH